MEVRKPLDQVRGERDANGLRSERCAGSAHGRHRRVRPLQRGEVLLRIHLPRDGPFLDNVAYARHRVRDGCGGDGQERIGEDVRPEASRVGRDVASGLLLGVGRERSVVAVGRVGREAQFVHDVGRTKEGVCVCEAAADVCASA